MPLSRQDGLPLEAMEADGFVVSFGTGAITAIARLLPSEEPVGIVYGGVPFAVMMVTPSCLDDFAYGFSLTERVIEDQRDIRDIRIEQTESGLQCSITYPPPATVRSRARDLDITLAGIARRDSMTAFHGNGIERLLQLEPVA
jgi:FdhD protein